jgi:dolichol-phosphate mannosyltransferase
VGYEDTTIILPTINEGSNIKKMITILLKKYPGIRILVVDDGSTDSTREDVKRIARAHKNVRLFDRKARGLQKGLTNSVIDGMKFANTRFAIAMDADFQHPIDKIGQVKRELDRGNKLVVAVRASVPGWELYRKIISKFFIYFGYIILEIGGKARCRDIFSGYFGVERKFFLNILSKNRRRFMGEGYKVLFDFLKCIDRGSIEIREVPYVFHVRMAGTSKASLKQGVALFKSFFS